MCFVLIGINEESDEHIAPILIAKHPSMGMAIQNKNTLDLQNQNHTDDILAIIERTKPLSSKELGITNANTYREYCRQKKEEKLTLYKSLVVPEYYNFKLYIF